MKTSILLAILIVSIVIAACNDNTTDQPRTDAFSEKPANKEDSLEHAVMEGHDVAMAKISTIRRYLAQIKQQQDSIAKLPAKQLDKAYWQSLTALEKDLRQADSSMNSWMEAYVMDSAKDNKELRIKYLEAEKQKVDTVKNLVLESVERAGAVLKKP
jgi:paraquat-inducible protein B